MFGSYKTSSELGRGGMAVVYLAEHQLLHNQVAIKVLNNEFVRNEHIRRRFLAEARNMARMSHPNIIKVTDLIDEGDNVAFVMEYIEGDTLKDYLERKGKLSEKEIKNIFTQMLDAVGYVHEQKLVHRDIKPSNFMITPNGKVKLMDFGIAKNTDSSSAEYTQTGTGVQMGTPMYMSPEQVTETKSVTAQSDIYSLGVLLWQMVSGRKPYDMATLSAFHLQSKIVNEPLENTGTAWDSLIRKATAKEITLRYTSAAELKRCVAELKSEKRADVKSEKTVIENDTEHFIQPAKQEEKKKPETEPLPSLSKSNKDNVSDKNAKRGWLSLLLRGMLQLAGILLLLLVVGGLLLEEPYPNSRDEMIQMLSNKCWKLDEIEINSIVIDGKEISEPSSGFRQTLKESVSGSDDRLIWSEIENSLNELKTDKYQFDYYRNSSNGKFYYYNQSFDKEISKPTYSFQEIEFVLTDDKYQVNNLNDDKKYTFDDEAVESDIETESDQTKIIGLSEDMLKVEESFKAKINGIEIQSKMTFKYKIISESAANTQNLNRVIEDYERLIHLFEQTVQ